MAGWSAEALVARHAREAGDDAAIIEAGRAITWAELDARARGAAAGITAAGVGPGDLVAVALEPSADAIAVLLGGLRAGAVVAPLPAGLTGRETDAALDLVRPAHVVRDARAVIAPEGAAGPPRGDRDPAAPVIVVLTSGTTGRPRGVVLSGRALVESADAWLAAVPEATGWLLALGLGHVAGLGIVWRAIAGRVPVWVVPAGDPRAQLAALEARPAPSHVSLVPPQLARLLDETGDQPRPPALRAVLLGGGPVPPDLVRRALDAGWPVVPTYGLSEAGSGVTALPADEAAEAPGSAGWPLPGVQVTIEEPDGDGVGEIVVVSPAAFSGYLGEPSRAPGDPIRTGDLGHLDDRGRLHVLDRRTDRIVRGGENVDPAEVEAVLEGHPAVREAAVVGRPDPTWGHAPVAAIVVEPAAPDPGDEALAARCRTELAGFKVPAGFLRLDALPRTPGGKLRRAAVRALVDGSTAGELARPDGDAIGWRLTGSGPLPVVLLHGTLSTSAQLTRLAEELARPGDVTVHAIDRRSGGTGRLAVPRALDIAVHVADLIAYFDARGIPAAALVGVSFGGALALEVAARHPDRALAVVAWEPPYGPLADEAIQRHFALLGRAIARAHRAGGPPAAAEVFLRAVAGDQAWDRLPDRGRAFLAREGDGVLADAALLGLDPAGLPRITAATTILTGGASEAFYHPIAAALAERVPGAARDTLAGLSHPAPITHPTRVAAAVRAALASADLVAFPVPEPAA